MTPDPEIVRARWPDADAFYAERDHRTRLEVIRLDSYVHTPIEIHVDPTTADDVTTQRIAILAANLVARWARNVRVVVPEVRLREPLAVHGDLLLRERIAREMREADPFGAFEVGPRVTANPTSLRLHVGPTEGGTAALTDLDYVVDATGWSALGFRVGSASSYRRNPAMAAAAALAAAIGTADLFKRAIRHPRDQWLGSAAWCTWHHRLKPHYDADCEGPVIQPRTDIGNVLLAGVGAVGSAVAYILAMMPLAGRLTVLDRDAVETSNLNRSPLFSARDAALMRSKVETVRGFLNRVGMEVEAIDGQWRDHEETLSARAFDAWVSLTNEDGAWAGVPFLLPPVVLHGTTTSGWGVCCGRHIPRVEDCTACRLPRPHAEFRGPCAQGDVAPAPQEVPIHASLPFLSVAAGALVAAELSKLGFPGALCLPNAVSADFRFGLPAVMALSVGPSASCKGCAMAHLSAWDSRGGRGRYRDLSRIREVSLA